MPLPRPREARPYYRAAHQRFEDALILFRHERNTGAMYLAGYAVECMLKALVLSTAGGRARAQLMKEMRGARAHDFAWLRGAYLRLGGAPFSRSVHREFVLVNSWNTNLRYAAGTQRKDVTGAFLNAAEAVIQWADKRL